MQVVLNTTAMALHPDALQQHASTPIAVYPLLEEDATNPLWVVAIFVTFSLHIMLLVLQKSGKPYVLALQSYLLCHCYCVILHKIVIIEQQDIVSHCVLGSAMYVHTHPYIGKQNAWSTPELQCSDSSATATCVILHVELMQNVPT